MSKYTKQQKKNKRKNKVKGKKRRLVTIKSKQKKESDQYNQVSIDQIKTIIDKSETGTLSQEDRQLLLSVSETLEFLTEQLEKKNISIKRLRNILFGASTEKLDKVAKKDQDKDGQGDKDTPDTKKTKKQGHGRNSSKDYVNAKTVTIPHESLKPGDSCPSCMKGTVYKAQKPKTITRVTGQAPLTATIYELEKLRCNLCGKIFTAKSPDDVGTKKYDPESISMIALLKYGTGIPFNRLERLQRSLGIPLAASTQWDTLSKNEYAFSLAYQALIEKAAQGNIIHNDDTTMKVLNLPKLGKSNKNGSKRKGVYTSGIVSIDTDHLISLFFTGHQYAGENLADILKYRKSELPAPIQMSDALSQNIAEGFKTILANCLAHARRKFVDIYANFTDQCHYSLESLAKIYKFDSIARIYNLSDDDRLYLHQIESTPVMADLKIWLFRQINDNLAEPNSDLGKSITYMLNHWPKLTLFLSQAGAPIDNNICERALKKAILHRKNSYYYRTDNGARVGDMFMSLIHTCELNKINPFDYLTELQKHSESVALCPYDWMPWNYQESVSKYPAAMQD